MVPITPVGISVTTDIGRLCVIAVWIGDIPGISAGSIDVGPCGYGDIGYDSGSGPGVGKYASGGAIGIAAGIGAGAIAGIGGPGA